MPDGFLFGACSKCCEGCRGSCDDENPCAEGCCCCDGKCVADIPCELSSFYVNGEVYPVAESQVGYPCWLPEIAPEILAGIEPTNTASAYISGSFNDSACAITLFWNSAACGTVSGSGPSPSGFNTVYATEWQPCGVNPETGRTVLKLISTEVLFWDFEGDSPPPEPDFDSVVLEFDCNPLP
jgi:hypothetical protein